MARFLRTSGSRTSGGHASVGVRAAAATAAVLIALAGCNASSGSEPLPVPAPLPSSSVTSSTAGGSPRPSTTATESAQPVENDLKDDRVKRTFDAGEVTVNVEYSTSLPTKDWTPGALKPLSVSLTAIVNSERAKKIYLTRVTVNSVVTSEGETLDSPSPLVDAANISPGYIVTFPYTYGQVFTVPTLDDGATQLRINLTYEMLLQTDPKVRDYQKQTATDTLVIPLR